MGRFRKIALALALGLIPACGEGEGPAAPAGEVGGDLTDDLSWLRAMAPGGALVYSADKVVYVVELADGVARKVGEGMFPEFSPDGSKVAWVDSGGLSVSNRDGSDARLLHDRMFKHGGAHWLDGESLAAVLQGGDGLHWYRFWLDGRRAPMPELDRFGINKDKARETDVRRGADGVWTHVAYRSWKTSDGKSGPIDGGCACSISPDGKSITALQGNHTELTIRPVRAGGLTHDLKWLYPGRFDNHRWSSNDERILVGVEERSKRMVVIDWRSGRASAFGKSGNKDKSRMYGDFTRADGKSAKPMPALLPKVRRESAGATVDADRGEPVELEVWPYRTDGMVFLFESRSAPNEFREFSKDPPRSSSGQLRDRAVFDRHGALALVGGHYESGGEAAVEWLRRIGAGGAFAIEFTAHPPISPAGKGTIVDLGVATLEYRDESLCYVDATDGVSTKLAKLRPTFPNHLVVSFSEGALSATLDGEPVFSGSVPSPPTNSTLDRFVFGEGWWGKLEGIAIFSRSIDAAEAKRRFELFAPRFASRKPVPRTTVDAKLVTYTPPLALEEMDTYRRSVSEHVFETVPTKFAVGSPAEPRRIRVRAWSILDMKVLPEELRGKEGQTFELTLEPEDAHPYLEKLERLNAYEGDDALELEGYFLMAPARAADRN